MTYSKISYFLQQKTVLIFLSVHETRFLLRLKKLLLLSALKKRFSHTRVCNSISQYAHQRGCESQSDLDENAVRIQFWKCDKPSRQVKLPFGQTLAVAHLRCFYLSGCGYIFLRTEPLFSSRRQSLEWSLFTLASNVNSGTRDILGWIFV